LGLNLQNLKNSFEVEPLSVRYCPNQHFDRDTIIHLTGKAHDLKKYLESTLLHEANFELTKQFDAFLGSEASVFIFMSYC
jgi:hypothetical protein